MNEVRDIVARMMEDPAPPPRPPEEVLTLARQANRRRSWATAAGTAALVLVMVVGAGVTVRSRLTAPATEAPVTSAAAPIAEATAVHGEVMAQRLVAMLPKGLAAGYVETFSEATRPAVGSGGGRVGLLAAAVVRVFSDRGEGELFAYLVRDAASGAGCSDRGAGAGGPADCRTVQVDDMTIEVVTRVDPVRGTNIEATRFLDGGRLIVGGWSGPPIDGSAPAGRTYAVTWPPLEQPPLEPSALVALAADPAMLPR